MRHGMVTGGEGGQAEGRVVFSSTLTPRRAGIRYPSRPRVEMTEDEQLFLTRRPTTPRFPSP